MWIIKTTCIFFRTSRRIEVSFTQFLFLAYVPGTNLCKNVYILDKYEFFLSMVEIMFQAKYRTELTFSRTSCPESIYWLTSRENLSLATLYSAIWSTWLKGWEDPFWKLETGVTSYWIAEGLQQTRTTENSSLVFSTGRSTNLTMLNVQNISIHIP